MGFFDSILGKKKPQSLSPSMRDTLFGDAPLENWPPGDPDPIMPPWDLFVSARSHLAAGNSDVAKECWQSILKQPGLEARMYLQAWHFLRQQGKIPPPEVAKQVLGVVVEVGMRGGFDLLAAYRDYSARYYNYSKGGIVWEHPDDSLNSNIDQLLAASQLVVDKIGPWDKPRPLAPSGNVTRLNFLTPSGLHFGQGPMAALARDPLAGGVINSATILMKALIAKAGK
jgi:hypothetical protein